MRGSSRLVLAEAERSIHDALCVIRCLVKKRALIAGGGAPEIEVALRLAERSQSLTGSEAYCVRAFAEAMEVGDALRAGTARTHGARGCLLTATHNARFPRVFSGCAVYARGKCRPEPHLHRHGPPRPPPGRRPQHWHQRPQGGPRGRGCVFFFFLFLFAYVLLSRSLLCSHSFTTAPQGAITDILEENVVQPLLVSTSALNLATETVCMILKIDDLVVVM